MKVEGMSLPITGAALLPVESDHGQPAVRELTEAVRAGHEDSFTQLHGLYSLRLYKYLLVLTKGDELEAREVLQIVFVKVARKMELFDEERRLWSWLCRLTRNVFVDRYRSRRSRDARNVSLDQLPLESAAGGSQTQLSHSLQTALEMFAVDDAELLRAAYIDERPLQELADEAGQSYKALESRLGRLRKKLKETVFRNLRDENK
jgi:RNA polymerase sigma-70 factor (ECF subfamily)